ncbi:MAG: GNAT family N-acetyltransferase [Ruminococcaceae bacterium]|nr:GNAT family N-acetyltransferase [Oscillospiraceae bacterium]
MYQFSFSPYPIIETERLILRKPTLRDAEEIFELCRRPETSQYSYWRPHNNINETREMIKQKLSSIRQGKLPPFFSVEEKESGRVIGTCSYVSADEFYKSVEIGYSILSDCWGNGFGTEVAWGLTGYAFDRMEAQRVYARVLPDNIASLNLLQKLGFTFEAVLKKDFFFEGKVSDVAILSMTDDEYFEIIEETECEQNGTQENS